jgi:nucleotide-binding universal stress UspA family protein
MLEKILVPLDGSPLGENTLVYAAELAIALGSEVQMVCATARHDEETNRMCCLYLQKLAEQMYTQVKQGNPGANVKTVVVNGEAADALLGFAVKEEIGLIILSSHGHSGIMPWSMGSTANKVVQRSQVPILLVKPDGTQKRKAGLFRKILVPLDGSPMGETALPYVLKIATALKSEVIFLLVVETVQHVHTIGGRDTIIFHDQVIEQLKKEATSYLESAAGKIGNNIKIQTILKVGDAAQEIIKVAAEEKVDITAMSSHGKSGITRWVLGSVTNKILQAGKTPLLLVRPPVTG